MNPVPTLTALALAGVTASITLAQDADWQFRGPGGFAVGDDTTIPTSFGPDENVLWRTEIPTGQSSPCIVADRIYLSGFADGANVALALDLVTGAVIWKKTFEGTPPDQPLFHPDAAPASPSPVSDGRRVVFYFGDYGLVAIDLDGQVLWEKRLPYPGHWFGVGNSPLLVDDAVVLSRDGGPEAAILALDLADGSERWRIDRFRHRESHGSPFLWRNADRAEIVVPGSGVLDSYDPATGAQLWSIGGLTSFPCTTPTGDADTLYYAAWSTGEATGRSFWEAGFTRSLDLSDAEVAEPALIFKRLDVNGDGKVVPDELPECRVKDAFMFLDRNRSGAWEVQEFAEPPKQGSGRNMMVAVARGSAGDASGSHVRWRRTRGLPYVASPLLYRDRVWLFKSGGIVSCLDATTGEPIIDRKRLSDRSEYYMSPVGAAGHVLIGSAEGTMYVLDATADELTVEHTVEFDDGLFATPAVQGGIIYLRSRSTMWAFGTTSSTPKEDTP